MRRELVRVQRSEKCRRRLPHKRVLKIEQGAERDVLCSKAEQQRTHLVNVHEDVRVCV